MMQNSLNKSPEKRLLEKRKYMEKVKKPRISVLDNIITFAIPELEKMDINSIDAKGSHTPGERYNGYAMLAVDLYASGWFGYSISPALDWFRIIDSDPRWMLNEEVNLWMNFVENRLYTIFENSNFYEIEALKLRYSPTMGFCTSYMEEDLSTGLPVFKIFHPGKILIMEDAHGRASTTLIIDKIQIGDAIERFGEKNLSASLVNAAMNDEYQEWEFCHLVEPNPDQDERSILNTKFPFRSVWWQSKAEGVEGIKICRTSGFPFNPYVNWRIRTGTTPYGYGLAEAALVDIMQSNMMTKDLLMASNKAADPPYNAPIEMQGMVDLRPHGPNYYENPERIVRPFNTGIQYPVAREEREEVKEVIRQHFHVDFFTLVAQMQGKAMTATQVIELAGEKAAVISMPIMKYNYENLEQTFKNIFMIERKAGRIPPPPAVYGNKQPVVDFIGPLAQAQRKLFQGRGIQSGIEQSRLIWELRPETMDAIDFDEVQSFILNTNNFPASAIVKKEKRDEKRIARAKAEEQQQRAQAMMTESATAVNMAKADKYTGGKITESLEAQQ